MPLVGANNLVHYTDATSDSHERLTRPDVQSAVKAATRDAHRRDTSSTGQHLLVMAV
jgi:hypothetical protein